MLKVYTSYTMIDFIIPRWGGEVKAAGQAGCDMGIRQKKEAARSGLMWYADVQINAQARPAAFSRSSRRLRKYSSRSQLTMTRLST